MDLVIVRNETEFDFSVPYGQLGALGSRPGSLDIPRGLSIHSADTWSQAIPDEARTGGSGGGLTGTRPPTLSEALGSGDVTVEEREVDPAETEDDPADIAQKLFDVYEAHTQQIHTAMSTPWSGAARRFASNTGISLNGVARGRSVLNHEQINWLKAISVIVAELFTAEAATVT